MREREICLLSWAVPRPPRVAWGIGANLPRPVAGVMFAPAAALRPPSGRPGSPSRPRHAASTTRGGRGGLSRLQRKTESSQTGKLFFLTFVRAAVTHSISGARVFLTYVGVSAPAPKRVTRPFFDVEEWPLCFPVFGRYFLPFLKGKKLLMPPGDGRRRKCYDIPVTPHPPE